MLLLAVDTSGAAVTAALHDGTRVLAGRSTRDPRRHAELLAPAIEEVLAEAGAGRADLTTVAVGVGPGPFTGLRAGIVTGLVLGLALGVPVHGVCSLDALALQVARDVLAGAPASGDTFAVATDARRREVYWAVYARPSGSSSPGDPPERLSGPLVTAPEVLRDETADAVPVFGRGATLRRDLFAAPPGPLDVDAAAVAEVAVRRLAAGAGGLLPPEPLYLRRPDATPPGERKRVLR